MDTCVSRLGYVGVEVSDLSAWRDFAPGILGLECEEAHGGDTLLLRMDEKNHRIALHAGTRDDLVYAGWEVQDDATLERLAERLVARGLDVAWASESQAAARKVERYFSVVAPGGLRCEIYRGLANARRPFASPRDLRGFVTGEQGFGHVALCVEDYHAALHFYRDGLGLKISDYIDVDMGPAGSKTVAFLHAGPRHHSVAIVPLAAPKRMHHLMLQLKDIDDVGMSYDLCQDRDVPIVMSLGRHPNDQMTSFYLQSPSGFQVELGHGGIAIDDDVWDVAHYDAPSVWGHRPASRA